MLQALNVTGGHGRVKFHFLVFSAGLDLLPKALLRCQRLAHARPALARLGFTFCTGQQLRQQLVGHFGILKVNVKQLTKDQAVLFAADHDGFKGGTQVGFFTDANSQCGFFGQRDAAAVDLDAGTPQSSAKTGDVVGQLAAAGVT